MVKAKSINPRDLSAQKFVIGGVPVQLKSSK